MTPDCTTEPATGAFRAAADGWRFDGRLTLENAATVMAASDELAFPPSGLVDFAGLVHGDSAALAVIMALRRRAIREGHALRVLNLPNALASLAVVYGVDELVRGSP